MNRLQRVGVAVLLAAAACSGPDVPLPDLSGAEPLVKNKIEQLRAMVRIDPTFANWSQYARTLHAHGMVEIAEKAYLAAVDLSAGPVAFEHLHLAGVATLDFAPERAVEHFRRALDLRKDHVPTHLYLGLVFEQMQRFDEASQEFKTVLASEPSSHAHLGLGRIALAKGAAQGALTHFEQALKINPQHGEVYEAQSRAYAQLGRTEESQAAAKRAGDLSQPTLFVDRLMGKVEIENWSYASLEHKARVLLAQDQEGERNPARLQQALEFLTLAITARPDAAEAHFYAGSALARLGRNDEAMQAFRKVVELEPTHLHARFYLAVLLEGAGKRAEALPHLDAVLERQGDFRDALQHRASLLLAEGRREDAERDLKALLALDAEHAWAREQLDKLGK
jgi:tetratricopeptide (TPR) repeat protein